MLEVLELSRRISGVAIPAEIVARRRSDPAAVYADNQKAREILVWTSRNGLEQIIRPAWQWHHGHPDGFLTT